MKFTELDLDQRLLKGIEEIGFEECLPVQEETFKHTFKNKDVYVQSQTGTGKTAAFLITIFQRMLKEKSEKFMRALIVAPTRELAEQIGDEAKLLGKYTGIKTGTFYGGVGYASQEKLLQEGVEIIVGTPGRLIDFSRSGKLDLRTVSILVIDEADRLFDMGFLPDLKIIIRMMPDKEYRQTMLYSATLDRRVRDIADEYMKDACEVEIQPEMITVENVTQKLYHVGRDEKVNLLLGILKTENPKNAIIFTNTKIKAAEVAERLRHNGYDCQYIIGDLPQKNRLEIIDRVKSGDIKLLIATDVASRGLHIDDLEMVINYDLPENCESYVHRIGRTARLGKSGKAISLACDKYVYGLDAIESYTKMKIPVHWAEDSLYEVDKAEGRALSSLRKTRKGEKRPARAHTRERDRKRPGRPAQIKDNTDRSKKWKEREAVKPAREERKAPAKHEHGKRQYRQDLPDRPPQNASLDERLAYYSKKYGEDFIVVTEPANVKKTGGKGNFLKKLFKFIRK